MQYEKSAPAKVRVADVFGAGAVYWATRFSPVLGVSPFWNVASERSGDALSRYGPLSTLFAVTLFSAYVEARIACVLTARRPIASSSIQKLGVRVHSGDRGWVCVGERGRRTAVKP